MVLTITYLYKCDFCILNDDQSECNVLTASDWLTTAAREDCHLCCCYETQPEGELHTEMV